MDTDDNPTCNDCVRIYNDLSTGELYKIILSLLIESSEQVDQMLTLLHAKAEDTGTIHIHLQVEMSIMETSGVVVEKASASVTNVLNLKSAPSVEQVLFEK